MKISIYEEFPNAGLNKLYHIDFPANLMIACKSLREFKGLERDILRSNSNINRVGYWPVLERNEGYWFSPFADGKAVEKVIGELEERTSEDLELILKWDVEPPIRWHKLITNSFEFRENKKRINNFLRDKDLYNFKLVTAENAAPIPFKEKLGLEFDPEIYDNDVIKMAYTSFYKNFKNVFGEKISSNLWGEEMLKKTIEQGKEKYKDKFGVALGCIAKGILGWEAVLTPEELDRDLKFVNEQGVDNVYLFRLEGFNNEISDVVRQYVK